MKNKLFLLIAAAWVISPRLSPAAAFTAQDFDFEQENKAIATTSVSIRTLPDGREEFSYDVSNLPQSQRPIILFSVQVDTSSMDMTAPVGWTSPGCCINDTIRKAASGIRVARWLYDQESALIRPGKSLAGYTLTARALPGFRSFFVQSFTDKETPAYEGGDPSAEAFLFEAENFFNNSTSGVTIGPETVPPDTTTNGLVDRLVSLKHQSIPLGWLRGDEFVRELDKKLEQAKLALAQNKPVKARKRLEQFIKLLEEQRRKQQEDAREHERDGGERDENGDHKDTKPFLNDNAFFLLNVNAEFIVSKLPAKPTDESDDDRDSEGGIKPEKRDGK